MTIFIQNTTHGIHVMRANTHRERGRDIKSNVFVCAHGGLQVKM